MALKTKYTSNVSLVNHSQPRKMTTAQVNHKLHQQKFATNECCVHVTVIKLNDLTYFHGY